MSVKSYKVIIDEMAFEDLVGIHAYIREFAPDTAAEFIARLITDCYKLEMFPYGHQQRPPSTRYPFPMWQRPFQSYRIIYTIIEEHQVVRILGVQHGSRNTWP